MPQLYLTSPALHILAYTDDLVLPSVRVKTLCDWDISFRSYINFKGNAVSPTARMILCVRFIYFVRWSSTSSAIDATLDTGGWLDLTRQGLSPCKMHQACLAH